MNNKNEITLDWLLPLEEDEQFLGGLKKDIGENNPEKITLYNDSGDVVMFTYWYDPGFDSTQGAFYYVRVIEIPTPH